MEQFPNYTFWVEVGNLSAVSLIIDVSETAGDVFLFAFFCVISKFITNFFHSPLQDGCDFVCRSGNREESPAYRGVAQDTLEEEPEERDDHLLPM